MKMMFPILQECSEELKDVLKEPAKRGEVIEIKEIAARFTTDIISLCAFGIKTNSLRNPDAIFRKMGKRALDPTIMEAIKGSLITFTPNLAKLFRVSSIISSKMMLMVNKSILTYHYHKLTNFPADYYNTKGCNKILPGSCSRNHGLQRKK